MQISTKRLWSVVTTLAVALCALVVAAPALPQSSANTTIVIWTDHDRNAAVTKVAGDWASSRGVTVKVVEKAFGDIRDNLKTVAAADAPDVIVGAHDWTGELAANGLVVPLFPKKATLTQFPSYTLAAFSYGTAVKKLYGAPVAVENIGLVVNTKLAKVPTTFAQLESEALAFKKKKKGNLAIAVQQGANGDAYHMYPFFAGLGGYIFGKNNAGNLDPSDIGIANKAFIKNAPMIDKWNKEGLINAKVDSTTAQNAFLKGQAAFWVTGPWNIDTIKKQGIKFKVIQVPAVTQASVPFLGVQGFLVTKFAGEHGNDAAAKDLVASYMMTPAAQQVLAAANNRYPANVQAGNKVSDPYLAQFGKAAKGGVPMPNIPQMNSVWQDLGGAWVKSTKGSGATKAAVAFRVAARNIAAKIG
jgi:arabinogalactan oligomer / maltooligosaccharide transport system substrate-binding protein